MALSAVVITLNEEENIERCLESLRFADEIVVLDSFSADGTVEIARRYTDNISCREFNGMSEQKSAAVEMAANEWFLLVDADEVITYELAAEISEVMKNPECDAYRMPRLTQFLGRPMRHSGWYPDYQTRLARKSKITFPHRLVHAPMVVDGTCGTLKHHMLHYTYPTISDYVRKMIQYNRPAARQKLREGRKFHVSDLVFKPPLRFLKKFVLQQGFRDGMHGFVLSALTACSSAIRYAMLWEMSLEHSSEEEAK
ncbi:MAG: hypothetical protein A2Z18_04570 [Armatimonadetes bacterium RBG_16_58_9]|nr:MAG: hypothetical protein A2Z18_04570 [Armatimonadetes bacterium RBG_16_58_9]